MNPIAQRSPVTGISLSNNIGTATINDQPLIGSGWGRSYYGDFVWGDNYSTQTGSVSAQLAINGVTTQADANVNVQGQSLSIVTGNELPEADANVFPTGISLTTTTGDVQALRLQGSAMSTGVGTVDIAAGGNVFVNVTEHNLQSSAGQVFAFANYIEEVSGNQINTSIGNEFVFTDVTVELTGISATTEIGNEFAFTDVTVEVTGEEINTFIGNETAFTDVTVSVTGQAINGSLGNIVPISTYSVDGISATTSIGSVTTQANADVPVTGTSLTISTITPNIIAWAEVDTGTDVVWTPVDLAA